MKTINTLRTIAFAILGFLTFSLWAGEIPEFTKKKPTRMIEKFSEMKNSEKKKVDKNTYVVKDQMLHMYNAFSNDYDTISSFHYQYVWSVLVSEKLTKNYYNGAFENAEIQHHFKDEKGRDTSIVYQFWSEDQKGWINFGRMVTHFDDHDNITLQAGYSWMDNQWSMDWGQEEIYEYNPQGQVLSITYSYYSMGSWNLDWRDLMEYNNDGLLSAMVEQWWDEWDEVWENDYREEYTYANNEWSELHGYWWDDWDEEWIPDMWATDIVWENFSNFLWAEVLILEHDGENWVNYERGSASYNAMQMPLKIQFDLWYNDEWENDWRMTWEYDNFYNVTLMKDEDWTGDSWEMVWGESYIYEYDENNNIAVEYLEAFYGWWKSWEKIHKLESWYEDVTGIPTSGLNSSSVNVFPNPAGNLINLQLDGNLPGMPVQYQILDLTGRTVMAGNISISEGAVTQLNIQEIPEGMYMVRVECGNIIETIKIIKR